MDAGALDAVQATCERLDHRRHLGCEPVRNGQQVDARDRLGHEQPLGVCTVQEAEVGAVAVRVRGDDAAAVLRHAAELVAERRG